MARLCQTPYSRRAGAFLRRERRARGYTQERFADEFGVSARHVRRWESEGIDSLDTLQQLLEFFNKTVKDISFDQGDILDSFSGFFEKRTKVVLVFAGGRW